jgi:hypothetical protein
MGRPGSKAAYFGPCVATSLEAAESLMRWFVGRHAEELVYWDLLPGNREAVFLAERFGFTRIRQLVRMARGQSRVAPDPQNISAIAGFEFG